MTDPQPQSLVPRVLLVGVDYSAESRCAAEHALRYARALGAHVHLLHAWVAPYAPPTIAPGDGSPVDAAADLTTPDLLALVRRTAEEQMAQFVAALDASDVSVTTNIESGDPRKVIPDYAKRHACDWVIVGKRSLSHVSEWFLGNVATYVVRHCQVPVLVVPSREAP